MRNMNEIMQKAQKMQAQMAAMQSEVEENEFVGVAANGAVRVTLTGKGNAVKVQLDKAVVDPEDIETLEDLIIVAVNDARFQADNAMNNAMQKLQSSLGLPPGFKLPM